MSRRLKTFVHVHERDEAGNIVSSQAFGPDDELPKWAISQLGDHVFEGEAEQVEPVQGEAEPENEAEVAEPVQGEAKAKPVKASGR